jgi:hypothetical protein
MHLIDIFIFAYYSFQNEKFDFIYEMQGKYFTGYVAASVAAI